MPPWPGTLKLKVIASVPSTFIRDRMISNGYTSQIESKLKEISGYNIKVELIIDNNMNEILQI